MITQVEAARLALEILAANDKYLPSLRERLNGVDGNESYRILPEIWPSIQAILALSDYATALTGDSLTQRETTRG